MLLADQMWTRKTLYRWAVAIWIPTPLGALLEWYYATRFVLVGIVVVGFRGWRSLLMASRLSTALAKRTMTASLCSTAVTRASLWPLTGPLTGTGRTGGRLRSRGLLLELLRGDHELACTTFDSFVFSLGTLLQRL